jgi:hypothetical protein
MIRRSRQTLSLITQRVRYQVSRHSGVSTLHGIAVYKVIIKFAVKTTIWLAYPPGATLVILDNLGWYCDLAVYQAIGKSDYWFSVPYEIHRTASMKC